MVKYKQITLLIITTIFVFVRCGGKKPDHYGVFVNTSEGVVEVAIHKVQDISTRTLLAAAESPIRSEIKTISIRHPDVNHTKILFIESPESMPVEVPMTFEKKAIDWIIYKPQQKMKEGFYKIGFGEEWTDEYSTVGCMAIFVYGSTQKFQELVGEWQKELKTRKLVSKIKENMHNVQVAVEDFATRADIYPAGLNVKASELRERGETVTLIELLPKDFKNPINPDVPPLTISFTDPPDWSRVEAGQVVYVPLEIVGKGAIRYKIYGKSDEGPLTLILTSGN